MPVLWHEAKFYNKLILDGGRDKDPPFDIKKEVTIGGKKVDKIVSYKDFGFPDFKSFVPGPKDKYKFNVDDEDFPSGKEITGDRGTDAKRANRVLKERFKDEPDKFQWDGKTNTFEVFENGKLVKYTWHHHEDGKTIIPVPFDINKKFSHSGGDSLIRNSMGRLRGFFDSPF